MEPPGLARAFLRHWSFLRNASEISRMTGGELKDVFRIDADAGSFVLRIYTPDVSADDVASELALMALFVEQLPEIPATIGTERGELYATENARVAVLAPFVEGEKPDRDNPEHRRAAAELLARLHSAAAAIETPAPRATYPALRDLDWHANRWWSWPEVEGFLREQQIELAAQVQRRIAGELAALPDAFAALSSLDLPSMPIHNDFFPGNLIECDGRIVGIVDWDECAVDWRALEIANASCEFARGDNDVALDPALVRTFLDDYVRAGGEILDRERDALLPLRRIRLVWETLYELGRACQGHPLDGPYLWGNLTSLDGVDEDVFA